MLTLVSRDGCHLCDQAVASLKRVCEPRGIGWRVVDIDAHPEFAVHTNDVPVLLGYDGEVLARLTASEAALRRVVCPPWYRRFLTN